MATIASKAKPTTARRLRRRAAAAATAPQVLKKRRAAPQMELALPPVGKGRGGARPGSGRKRANPRARPNMAHRARPGHAARCPVHVTMRAAKGVGIPSFRAETVQRLLKEALVKQSARDYGDAFQIVHFSIQRDHLHLVVEAKAPTADAIARHPRLVSKRAKRGLETNERDMLRRGIAGIAISFARRLNKLLGRKGKVWGDRHHRRDLDTPTEVRNALLYLFQNVRRHGARAFGPALDPFSTAMTFDGWNECTAPSVEPAPWCPPPRTWLLARGWLRAGGPLSPRDAPPMSPHVKRFPYAPYLIERNVSDERLRELGFLD